MKKVEISQGSHINNFQTNQKMEILKQEIKKSWEIIAPFWPLENLIAVNPLQGLENLPIEESFLKGAAYFEQEHLPDPMREINRITIKWMQVFCDSGQATITMPNRTEGLFRAWQQMIMICQHFFGQIITHIFGHFHNQLAINNH
jgi:uncharacterized protein YbcC (UPF0753/DUF2309 family)